MVNVLFYDNFAEVVIATNTSWIQIGHLVQLYSIVSQITSENIIDDVFKFYFLANGSHWKPAD